MARRKGPGRVSIGPDAVNGTIMEKGKKSPTNHSSRDGM